MDVLEPHFARVLAAIIAYLRRYVLFCGTVFDVLIDKSGLLTFVGWQASTSLRSDLAIHALEMAIYSRDKVDLSGLAHHSDREVQ
jgi:putative transposase